MLEEESSNLPYSTIHKCEVSHSWRVLTGHDGTPGDANDTQGYELTQRFHDGYTPDPLGTRPTGECRAGRYFLSRDIGGVSQGQRDPEKSGRARPILAEQPRSALLDHEHRKGTHDDP